MAGLGLKSISYMADKFPDKWMEKIPYYRAREEEIEEEEREQRRHARRHSRRRSHSHKRSHSHRRRDEYYEDEETSDDFNDEDHDRRERRRHRSLDGRRHEEDRRSSHRRSYNPADYAAVDRNAYAVRPPPTAFAEDIRPQSASGPIPGYVPYADVYSAPLKPRYTQPSKPVQHAGNGAADYPHDRDIHDYPERRERRDHHANHRHARYNDNRYDSGHRDHDNDSDTQYRRRHRYD